MKLKPTIKSRRRRGLTQATKGSRTSRLGISVDPLAAMLTSARTGAAFRALTESGAFASVCGAGVLFFFSVRRCGWLGPEIPLETAPSVFNRMERLLLAGLGLCFFAGEVLFSDCFLLLASLVLSVTSALSWMGRCRLPESLGFFFWRCFFTWGFFESAAPVLAAPRSAFSRMGRLRGLTPEVSSPSSIGGLKSV